MFILLYYKIFKILILMIEFNHLHSPNVIKIVQLRDLQTQNKKI